MASKVGEMGRGRPRWMAVARWAVALALVAWVADRLGAGLAGLPARAWQFDPVWLLASLPGLFGALFLGAECWRRWLVLSGAQLPFKDAFCILYQANVAKYLPGSVWHFAGRVVLAGRAGVPAAAASLSMLMDVVGHLAGALVFALVAAAVGGIAPPAGALSGVVVLMLGLHPRVLGVGFGMAGRVTGRSLPALTYRYGAVLWMLVLNVLDWCLVGAGFAAFARALVPIGPRDAVVMAGVLAVAWSCGALAVFAPAGLGVREAALVTLLARSVPTDVAAAIALGSRVWFVAGEMVVFWFALVWRPSDRREDPRQIV